MIHRRTYEESCALKQAMVKDFKVGIKLTEIAEKHNLKRDTALSILNKLGCHFFKERKPKEVNSRFHKRRQNTKDILNPENKVSFENPLGKKDPKQASQTLLMLLRKAAYVTRT